MQQQTIQTIKAWPEGRYQSRIYSIQFDPIDETTPYSKQLSRNQMYYQDNKEKVSQQQQKYKDSLSENDKSRAKVLYCLNVLHCTEFAQ